MRGASGQADGERTAGERDQFVVGIGASAGGLEALELFFAQAPIDDLAYVVVTHQQPGRVSLMPELLRKHSKLAVVEVTDGMPLLADHVYLAPGGAYVSLANGRLGLEPSGDVAPRMPIDAFFRSLAADQGERAIGVILSGTGTDGTQGIKAIKDHGGLVVAQEEASARFAGMPHSAIASDLVDFILPPEQIPACLVAHLHRLASEPPVTSSGSGDDAGGHRHILRILAGTTGHDFSSYKSSTIHRRIQRRMALHQLDDPRAYVRLLQATPAEVLALFKELLIRVTSFFRDPEAFAALADGPLAGLIDGKPDGQPVRAWVPGCASGEEAYSLAILMREHMTRTDRWLPVQIFATDLDAQSIAVARAGNFPPSISADVSAERLERFFVKDEDGYRVKKEVREMIVFAPQNLIADPPFTKIDLISCRNLLIYLDAALQRRLLPVFHYALRPGGLLFLGSSESIGQHDHLFRAVDKKARVFARREVAPGSYLARFSSTVTPEQALEAPAARARPPLAEGRLTNSAERVLCAHLVPPTLIVDRHGDVVHIHGRTGRFLEPAAGSPARPNLFDMAREGLATDLGAALRLASEDPTGVAVRRVERLHADGGDLAVEVRVRRLAEPELFRGLYLISFIDLPAPPPASPPARRRPRSGGDNNEAARLAELELELQRAEESHRGVMAQLGATNEEAQSTNEELQSTNEELQSTNEELETSKEEMQSLNEELSTVNAELQEKVELLSRTNDDMKNLLNATDIATVFLDSRLNIKGFTDSARRVISIIPSDVGRPIADLVSKLRYARLTEDARAVFQTLVAKEIELDSDDGATYLLRILPYRTADNVIDGLVLTFVDVTRTKGLEETERRLQRALARSPTSVFGQDRLLRFTWAYSPVLGHEPRQVIGKTEADLLAGVDAARWMEVKRRAIESGAPVRDLLSVTVDGKRALYDVFVQPVRDDDGTVAGVACVATDVTHLAAKEGLSK